MSVSKDQRRKLPFCDIYDTLTIRFIKGLILHTQFQFPLPFHLTYLVPMPSFPSSVYHLHPTISTMYLRLEKLASMHETLGVSLRYSCHLKLSALLLWPKRFQSLCVHKQKHMCPSKNMLDRQPIRGKELKDNLFSGRWLYCTILGDIYERW